MMTDMMTEKVLAYCDAIRTQDSRAFAGLWARHSECTLISVGKVFRGYSSIHDDFLIAGIQANYASIHLIPEDIEITYQDEASVIVTFRYRTECIRRADGSPYGIAGVETQVWKMEDDWRLIHLHYSKI